MVRPFLLLLLAGIAACDPSDAKDPAAPDADGDGFTAADDCDDADAAVFPGAAEVCDGVDQDCDRQADDGVITSWYPDADGDGYGVWGATTLACDEPAGTADNPDDCDDADADVFPGATEACDGVDQDCDGVSDSDVATWYDDADGDGYGDANTATDTCAPGDGAVTDGTDCDDTDAAANPGAEETCGDGDDDDCDGFADTSAAPQDWHPDADGDGFGHMITVYTVCDPDPAWVLDGTDCRPTDAEAHPGAVERCNDDDDDCDRLTDEDFELDGDGHSSEACGGDDCDDLDATTFLGADEICEDGVDNDCDGRDARCGFDATMSLGDVDVKVWSDQPNYDAGHLIDVGDIDADGLDDLVVATMYADSYNGGAYVLYGADLASGTLEDIGVRIEGERATYTAGRSIGVADVNGDGYEDVAIGAPDGTDREWITFGPILTDVDLMDADVSFTGTTNSETGHGSDLADIDGDGVADAIIGAYEDATGASYGGVVYLHLGPFSTGDDFDIVTEYDVRLIGTTASAYAGRYVRAGRDVDGDGIGDMLLAAPYSSLAAPYGGAAYLVYGGLTSDLDLSSADGIFLGEAASDYASEELALGDVDGDGLADVILGAYDAGAGRYAGKTYVVHGPASGTIGLAAADASIAGTTSGQDFGLGLAARDIDDDGVDDLLVGATGDATSATGAGAAYLFYGPVTAGLTLSDADAVFTGEAASDGVGEGVAIGDFDGDGQGDLAMGAPTEATGGSAAGAVYVAYPED